MLCTGQYRTGYDRKTTACGAVCTITLTAVFGNQKQDVHAHSWRWKDVCPSAGQATLLKWGLENRGRGLACVHASTFKLDPDNGLSFCRCPHPYMRYVLSQPGVIGGLIRRRH